MRRPLIAGNWKMFKTLGTAVPFVAELKEKLKDIADRDILLVPPYPFLQPIRSVTRGSNLLLGAQNLFWEDEGAFTGEVSPLMLKGVGCSHALIGHSERRQYFGETDETVNKRIKAALKHGLFPVVCIGETLEQREEKRTFDVLDTQMQGGLRDLTAGDMQKITIAYEPVWAIGTGKTATPELAEEVHSHIREKIKGIFDQGTASGARILYGGSVKPENIDELMAKDNIDGALVGGASLKTDAFERIVKFL